MGFRSTFVSRQTGKGFKKEFYDMYKNTIHTNHGLTPISSCVAGKMYFMYSELYEDIQKYYDWSQDKNDEGEVFTIVVLHECGGIDLVDITQNEIIEYQPSSFHINSEGGHEHCDRHADRTCCNHEDLHHNKHET